MRDRVLLRRDGEGVAWWVPLSVILAVLALLATSLSFPGSASAQETMTTPTTTRTSTDAAISQDDEPREQLPAQDTAQAEETLTTRSGQTRSSTSARPTPGPASTTGVPVAEPKPGPRGVEPRAINPGIKVEITEIVVDGGSPDDQISVGNNVEVHGTWDARNAAPQPGDEFTIGFPSELKLTKTANFDLVGDDNVIWGTCEVSVADNVMTCVLSDAVIDHPEDVHGSFYVYSKATKYTTAETVEFTVNGDVKVPGTLPGGGGITDGQLIGKAKKSGEMTPDKTAATWTIDIPGSDLIALDADGTGSVTLADTLSDNMKLCGDERLDATLKSGRPGSLTTVAGGVTVTQAGGAGTPITIAISNGAAFRADQVYQVQYTSCTTSGKVDLPVDGEAELYTNSVDIGGTIVSDGVGQDWKPQTSPSKKGSLNKKSRYSQLDWTITVPGTVIAEAAGHQVSIAEKLSDNHAICSSGLQPVVTMEDYLPGPGGGSAASQTVTDEFTIVPSDTAVPGAKSFSLTLTPKDIAGFDPEKYYLVKFRTCLTSKEVPDSSDEFVNTATVNGTTVKETVTGPTFTGSKKGTFNLAPTAVAGEEQPAGTTVGWNLEVPGHDLEKLDTNAIITDTFSDTLTVCSIGDDLRSNLNLSVIAKDFQNDADKNPTRDLTAATEVDRTEDGLTFTLPKEEGDYSREVVYDIAYTLCTASGGMDPRGTEYSNAAAWEGKSESSRVKQTSGGGGTGQGVSRGSFSLTKHIDTWSEEFPIDDTVFSVRVEEFAPGVDPAIGTAEATYTVKVKADGTPVSGVNARGTGWQIRLTEIDLPHGNGVYFEPGVFRPAKGVVLNADRTQALVTIQPKINVEVELVNKARLGTATVTKTVTGNATSELTGTEKFVVRANISTGVAGSGTEVREFTLQDGQFYNLGDLPIGTEVAISEVQPVDTDRVTWADPVIVPETLVIGRDPAANAVSVTNEASITEGTFQIAKALIGPEAHNPAVPETFQVLATWKDNGADREKVLTLPADGRPVPFGEHLPGGTHVTLKELVPADGNGLAWGVPAFSGDVSSTDAGTAVVTIGREARAVTVSNFVDTNDGTLRLTKQVSGDAAESVDDDDEFSVEARWREGTEFRTELLTVTQGESTPLGAYLPVGTEVTFTEVGRPEIAGVEWTGLEWGTDPSGESWLNTNPDGTATGIVSDDPTDGRLVTLTNEAQWRNGSVGFTKFVFDGENPVPATEAGLPDNAVFEVRIDGIDPVLPANVDFPAVGDSITLDAGNDWSWNSGEVLPRGTTITFSEVDPAPLAGLSWARPFYYVAADAGEPGDRNTVETMPGERAVVEIRNRPVPTTEVEIDKVVTGPKGGKVTTDESSTFQVTATWQDPDGEDRACIVDVTPRGGMTPTTECDAAVIDGRVQFPIDTEITFTETGAHTDVTNVKWGDVSWSVENGSAELAAIDGEPASAVVTLTGDAGDRVTLGLENKTSSTGLIFFPIPIPLPPFGGSSTPPGSSDPTGPSAPGSGDPTDPSDPGTPSTPGDPVSPERPGSHSPIGHAGAPGKPAPSRPGTQSESSALAVTGANVAWLGGAALALVAAGTALMLRNRTRQRAAD